ncbi:histidine phosphotransferase family protein [Yoonia sp. SS1-5]|uniref:Histidine phosphotransferase family protein n=2 Tax=Yoonia rhodophyticola TaxID=3137370 RepID=A0AAN0M7I4_9RHOB
MPNDLAALVGSRICHDLISPIGAIGNGVELLALTNGDSSAEMALISESVNNANARIRFFRLAFGAADADQSVSRAEIQSILAAMATGGRLNYNWTIPTDAPRPLVRCAFLLLQCMETALPLGGDVDISTDGDDWLLRAEGSRVNIEHPLWDSLQTTAPDYAHSAAQVQFAMLPDVLGMAGRSLQIDHDATQITARF